MRRGFILFLILLHQFYGVDTALADSRYQVEVGQLRLSFSQGTKRAVAMKVAKAYDEAYQMAASCQTLEEQDSKLKRKLLRHFLGQVLYLDGGTPDPDQIGECAYTGTNLLRIRIRLFPHAFERACGPLSETLLHEMIHTADYWLPEEEVVSLEVACAMEHYMRRKTVQKK